MLGNALLTAGSDVVVKDAIGNTLHRADGDVVIEKERIWASGGNLYTIFLQPWALRQLNRAEIYYFDSYLLQPTRIMKLSTKLVQRGCLKVY